MSVSIRFFDEREVRAIWDEENAKWRFSVLDVVGILNEENDYTKVRNYWKWLKTKLRSEDNEVVSDTTQLKLRAPDGKYHLTDTLDSGGMISLGRSGRKIFQKADSGLRLLSFWIPRCSRLSVCRKRPLMKLWISISK